MYICMYVYIYVYMHMRVCICVCMMYECMYVYVCICVCMYGMYGYRMKEKECVGGLSPTRVSSYLSYHHTYENDWNLTK